MPLNHAAHRRNKTVFLSGTSRVGDVLDQVSRSVKRMGFTPLLYSEPNFPVLEEDAMEACLAAVRRSHRFVLVLDERAGLKYPATGTTITEAEFNEAFKHKIPCLVFIRSRVWEQARVFHKGRRSEPGPIDKNKFASMNLDGDQEVYELIERLQHKKRNGRSAVPWIRSFNRAVDIIRAIRNWLLSRETKRRGFKRQQVSPDRRGQLVTGSDPKLLSGSDIRKWLPQRHQNAQDRIDDAALVRLLNHIPKLLTAASDAFVAKFSERFLTGLRATCVSGGIAQAARVLPPKPMYNVFDSGLHLSNDATQGSESQVVIALGRVAEWLNACETTLSFSKTRLERIGVSRRRGRSCEAQAYDECFRPAQHRCCPTEALGRIPQG